MWFFTVIFGALGVGLLVSIFQNIGYFLSVVLGLAAFLLLLVLPVIVIDKASKGKLTYSSRFSRDDAQERPQRFSEPVAHPNALSASGGNRPNAAPLLLPEVKPTPDRCLISMKRGILYCRAFATVLSACSWIPGIAGDLPLESQTEAIHPAAPGVQDMASRRVKIKAGVDEAEKRRNRTKARVRSKVESPFRILKRVFGFTKVHYRGLKWLQPASAETTSIPSVTAPWKRNEVKWAPAGSSHPMVLKGSAAAAIVVKLKSKGKPKALTGPQNPWIVDPQYYKIQFENSEVRVTRGRIGPKEGTPLHEHSLNRVFVYLTKMDFRVVPEGKKPEHAVQKSAQLPGALPSAIRSIT